MGVQRDLVVGAQRPIEHEPGVDAGPALRLQALVADEVAAIAEQLGQGRGAKVAAGARPQAQALDDLHAGPEAGRDPKFLLISSGVVDLALAAGHGEAAVGEVDPHGRGDQPPPVDEVLFEREAGA